MLIKTKKRVQRIIKIKQRKLNFNRRKSLQIRKRVQKYPQPNNNYNNNNNSYYNNNNNNVHHNNCLIIKKRATNNK